MSLRERKEVLEEWLKLLILPKDPNDAKNVIVEIRAGTGGDEAALVRGRAIPHVLALRRVARLARRDDELQSHRPGRLQRNHHQHRRPRRLFAGSSSKAACTACNAFP